MTGDSETDTISLTSTVEDAYDSSEEFQVERILAERDEDGRVVYLVKWENYGEFDISWQPVENFVTVGSEHAAIASWIETKKKQEKNLEKPFDVVRWERRMERFRQQKQDRQARRARKREKLGITKDDPEDLDYEEPRAMNEESESTDTSKAEEDDSTEERRTARGSRSKAPRQKGKKSSATSSTKNENSSDDDDDDTPLVRKRPSKPISITRAEPINDASDGSDEQPLAQKRASKTVSSSSKALSKRGSGNKSFLSASSAFSRTPIPGKNADATEASSRAAPIAGPSTQTTSASTTRRNLVADDPPRLNANSTKRPRSPAANSVAGEPKKKPAQLPSSSTARRSASNIPKKTAPVKPLNIFASNLNKPKDTPASQKKSETQDPGLFQRLSVQHRQQQKALADRVPDINSLQFVDLNNDNAASQPRQVSKVVKAAKQSAADTVTNTDGNGQIAELHPAEGQAGVATQTQHQLNQPPRAAGIVNTSQYASGPSNPQPTPPISTSESRAPVAPSALPKELTSSDNPLAETRDVASVTKLIDDTCDTEGHHLLLGRAQEDSNDNQEPGLDMTMHDSDAETRPASDKPNNLRPRQHNHDPATPTARPEYNQWPQQAHAYSTEVPPWVVDAQPPSWARFDAHPLPLTALEVLPDSRCTPVRAHFVFGQTWLPISLSNLPNSTRFLILKNVKDGQNVHLHLNALISAVDYKRLLPDNGDVFFGIGPVQARSDTSMSHRTADQALQKLQRTLETKWSAAAFFHESFTLLAYPTGGAQWRHFDDRLKKAEDSALRFVLRVPVKPSPNVGPRPNLDRGVLTGPTSRSGLRLLLRSVLGIDLRLIPEPETLSLSPRHFFLIYPEEARRDHDILVSALRRLDYKVSTSFVNGDWQHFVDTVVTKSSVADKEMGVTDAGVVLIHWSFTQLRAIPRLMRLVRAKDLLVYKINERSQSLPGQHSLGEIFPRIGGFAVMLLDSFFIHDPEGVAALLEWYHRSSANPSMSKWRLVVRPQIHSWLKEIARSLLASGKEGDLERAKVWMKLIQSVNKLVPPKDMCPIYDYEIADWHENPRLLSFMKYTCPGLCWDHPFRPEGSWVNHEQTTKNDEMLFQWFGAWSLEETSSYRRFVAVSGERDQNVYKRSMDQWPTRWRYIELWPGKEFLRTFVNGAKTSGKAGRVGA